MRVEVLGSLAAQPPQTSVSTLPKLASFLATHDSPHFSYVPWGRGDEKRRRTGGVSGREIIVGRALPPHSNQRHPPP